MKILILKPSSLGDVVQAMPVLRLLKQHFTGSEIHWWLGSEFLSLFQDDPDLAGIFRFERQRWKSPLNWFEVLASIRAMRAKRFDWVIDLQGLARSGMFAWMANGAFTIGVDDPREGARGFYDLAVPRPSPTTHAVDWYLEVLRVLKVPVHWNFIWLPAKPDAAVSVRRKWQPDSAQWIVINPGARWLNKRWPVEHFAELVRTLANKRPDARFAILGGRDDCPLGSTIAQAAPQRCLDLTGQTSLAEMIEWLRLSSLVVTNDTGPMHVAAALGKPIVALFGPTDPRRTGPYGQLERALRIELPCSPCLRQTCFYERPLECLRGISPAHVADVALGRLESSALW